MGDLQGATATGRYITGYHPDTPEAGGRRATDVEGFHTPYIKLPRTSTGGFLLSYGYSLFHYQLFPLDSIYRLTRKIQPHVIHVEPQISRRPLLCSTYAQTRCAEQQHLPQCRTSR